MLHNLDMRLLLRFAFLHLFFVCGQACLSGPPLGFYPQYGYGAPYSPYSAASRTRAASPTHTLTSANSVDELQPVSDCNLRFANQKLGCVQAFEKRMPSTEQDCQQTCEDYTSKCRAFQFDSLTNECSLFDVDQNGRPQISDNTFARDESFDSSYRHKRYTSTNPFDQFLHDPLKLLSPDQQSIYCEPALSPAIGTTFVQSDYNCRMASMQVPPTPPPPSFQPKSSTSSMAKMSPNRAPQMAVPIDTPDCPDGANARIQLIDGVELVQTKPVLSVQLDSPDACLHICRLNRHLDGTQFPRSCKSSAFDRSTGRCHIFDGAISPNGDLNYTPNSNSIYFEKFCIPVNELPEGCDDVIHRIPQHTLDKRAAGTGAIVTSATQINCIRQCISAARQLGFECMSVSYFFDWPSENCYLSRFTRISRPDIYVAERKQFVDYIEMSKCAQSKPSAWQHDAPWSEWSKCDETMTRSRQRNCTGCKKRKESVLCHNEMAFQHEFPKSLIETEIEAKKIATNFDSARRYKQPSRNSEVDHSEASLFGEHDYDNQHEVSFFGPPQPVTKNEDIPEEKLDNESELFGIRSSIRPIENRQKPDQTPPSSENENSNFGSVPSTPFDEPDPKDFESAEIFAQSQFNLGNDLNGESARKHKQVTTKRDEHSHNENDENELFKKALLDAEQHQDSEQHTEIEQHRNYKEIEHKEIEQHKNYKDDEHKEVEQHTNYKEIEHKEIEHNKDEENKSVETTTFSGNCNPKIKCCPRSGFNEKSTRLRGCIVGYKLTGDGKQVPCLTEEYCAELPLQASIAVNLSKTLNHLLLLWLFAYIFLIIFQ